MCVNCSNSGCGGCGSLQVPQGPSGFNGWSPQYQIVGDGPTREVLQLIGWTGGTGPNPGHVGEYLATAGGYTPTLALGRNIRGTDGINGRVFIKYVKEWTTGDIEQELTITYAEWTACGTPDPTCTVGTSMPFLDVVIQVYHESVITPGKWSQMTAIMSGTTGLTGGAEINIDIDDATGDITITTYNSQGNYRIVILG